MLLEIKDLSVTIDNKSILNNFNLKINKSEIHVIMGPNGVGKSTLSKVIMGDQNYNIKKGNIIFNNIDITNMSTDERARLGIFLSMQNPSEIEGVNNAEMLKVALFSKTGINTPLYEFIKNLEKASSDLDFNNDMVLRDINVGFSGGEKKKNEIMQMKILEPKLIILDEIDSGLDIDALKTVSKNIKEYLKNNKDRSILIITHYPKIMDYIKPNYVHIIIDGKIVKSGDYSLAKTIEEKGYEEIRSSIINHGIKNE